MLKSRIVLLLICCVAGGLFISSATAAPKPADLLAGAKWSYSLDGGKTFAPAPAVVPPETSGKLILKAEFQHPLPRKSQVGIVVLELTYGLAPHHKAAYFLNDKPIRGPLKGMFYHVIPAIDAKLLRKGTNVFRAELTVRNVSRGKHKAKPLTITPKMTLAALTPLHLKIRSGPVLGAFGEDYFTVTCRTNMPAKVKLTSVPIKSALSSGKLEKKVLATSGPGLIHRIRVNNWAKLRGKHSRFSIEAAIGPYTAHATIEPPTWSKHMPKFVALGDSRTHVKDWHSVASAVEKARANLVIHSGDFVSYGRNNRDWDREFFVPAYDLLRKVPFYAVIGNHEADAPLYDKMFYSPAKDGLPRNWAQTINGVLFIGIDGRKDWKANGKCARWLEQTLAGSKAKFIFLVSHYPAWSSANHGVLAGDGLPREREMRWSQTVIMPLLEKYKATAMITGHDHVYERSEPPGGVTHITSGGAGAPRYNKTKTAAKQNPHSKAFAPELHYCLFAPAGENYVLKALTPDGKELDTRTFKPRKVK